MRLCPQPFPHVIKTLLIMWMVQQRVEGLNEFLTRGDGRKAVRGTLSLTLDSRDSPIGGCGAGLGMIREQCDR